MMKNDTKEYKKRPRRQMTEISKKTERKFYDEKTKKIIVFFCCVWIFLMHVFITFFLSVWQYCF